MFPRIELLDWMQGRPAAALHDLGTTGLRGTRDVGDAVVPDPVADRDDPPAGVNLHSLLAAEYGVHPKQVVVTAGASHAAFLAAAAAVTDSDADQPRALVELPAYEPHAKTPAAVGAAVDRFRRTAEADFALEPDRIEAAVRPATALVTATNRHNPTGALADRATLADAADAAGTEDARLLVDEVYAPYVSESDAERTAFGGPTAAGLDGAVVVNSLSKFFGLPDLRVGWLVADEAFAERARAAKHHVPAVADVTERLAARAVHAAGAIADEQRALCTENAALLRSFVDDRPDVTGRVRPDCPFVALSAPGRPADELAAAAWEQGVLVVPGRFFGLDDRVRVSLGRSPEENAAALTALDDVLGSP
ncbi:MAG: pyridoxal phosphate-dependent aminotransferase [Halobacteriaceae archaeon]